MKKLIVFMLLVTMGCLAQAPAGSQQPGDPGVIKARRLLDQMIQALGGQAYLTYTTVEQTGRTYGFHHGEPSGAGTVFWRFYKYPDKERLELTKKRDWVVINNGNDGYEITFHGKIPQEKDTLDDYLRRRHYSLDQVIRVWLKQPGIQLFYEGQATAAQRPAEQISIMTAQNDSVTLYLDQDSHLPVKRSFVWRDPKTRERTEESETYANYKPVQGIMTPLVITRQRDNMNTNQRFITSTEYNLPMPDSLFTQQSLNEAKR